MRESPIPGISETKQGQRILAAGDKRAHCLAITAERSWSASLRREQDYFVRCEWRRNRWQTFFLAASDAEECSGFVTDPALLTSSSSRNARLRADEELICIMTKAVNELGLEWSPLRSHLAAECFLTRVFSHWALTKPPANARPLLPRSSYELTILWHASTRLASVLLLQLLSHIRWRRWRKRIRAPASSGWVCGRTSLCFPPSRSATAGTQASQGATAQAPLWWNQPWLSELIPAAESSSVADPFETGPPLSSERYDIASPARVIGPAYVAARREPFVLPERVLNTMPEARAPSTRRIYALKWAIFSTWCQGRDLVPVTSDVSVVLSFQQEIISYRLARHRRGLIRFFHLIRTNHMQLKLCDWKRLQWREKGDFSHTYSTRSHFSGNRGYESNRVRFTNMPWCFPQ